MMINAARSNKPGTIIRTIRMEDQQVAELLDRLDQHSPDAAARADAQSFTYRVKCKLYVTDAGGTSATVYLVSTRNLSSRNVRFLHGGYLHAGTGCMVQLLTPHGTWSDITGRIAECRYLESNLHEVTVAFDHGLDPAVYSPEAVPTRVLLVEDDPSLIRLAQLYLKQLRAAVDVATNGQEALQMAPSKTYDVVLMDMEMPVLDGFECVRQLRAGGYSGTIVAATGLTRPADKERCLTVGCDKYMPKPYTRDHLAELLKSLHEEPLFSTLAAEHAMTDLIADFVAGMPARIRQIEESARQSDVARLTTLLRQLKSEGTAYGFEIITHRAADIESALLDEAPIDRVRADLENLVKTCLQARSSAKG